jgi:hypothetical protein
MCCAKENLLEIAGVSVFRMTSDRSIVFQAGMEIDADGAYRAYHPPPDVGLGLDNIHNAGEPGNWFGIVTDNGRPDGTPVVQRSDDPAPGFFVSSTALEDPTKDRTDPRRYLDAETVPYIVLPGHMSVGAGLGDFAMVVNTRNDISVGAICGDIGPRNKIGEASIATAKEVGIPDSPRTGGISSKSVLYLIFVGSGNRQPRSLEEIANETGRLFADWGGMDRIRKCFQ